MRASLLTLAMVLVLALALGERTEASTPSNESSVTLPELVAHHEKLIGDVDRGVYGRVSRGDRQQIEQLSGSILATLNRHESFADFSSAERDQLAAAQERLNRILFHDLNQVVCHNERRVGTRIPTRVCRTLDEIRHDREQAELFMLLERNGPLGEGRVPGPASGTN